MMLLAEIAREEGSVRLAGGGGDAAMPRGSARRLFLLTYGVGVLVTVFLSNDATAVVLTPAVAAAVKTARRQQPLPYLLICAFVANAASFVLPISNPANLVIYGSHMPPLLQWLPAYLAAVGAGDRRDLCCAALDPARRAAAGDRRRSYRCRLCRVAGKTAALGIAATAVVLLAASALGHSARACHRGGGRRHGGGGAAARKTAPWHDHQKTSPGACCRWSPAVRPGRGAGQTGLIGTITGLLQAGVAHSVGRRRGRGLIVALASNLMNNLPAGLIAGSAVQSAQSPTQVTRAVLIGVDLGPNLSVTGSLATILWLTALRREGHRVGSALF